MLPRYAKSVLLSATGKQHATPTLVVTLNLPAQSHMPTARHSSAGNAKPASTIKYLSDSVRSLADAILGASIDT